MCVLEGRGGKGDGICRDVERAVAEG